jgi:hypothetical protein
MAEIHELHVAFLLARMDAQDPTMITERIGIEPTHAHRKGDPHPTRTNPDLKWRNSIWTLDSRLPGNARLDEHCAISLIVSIARLPTSPASAQTAGARSSAADSLWRRRTRGQPWPPKRSPGWPHSAANLDLTSILAMRPMIHRRHLIRRANLVGTPHRRRHQST